MLSRRHALATLAAFALLPVVACTSTQPTAATGDDAPAPAPQEVVVFAPGALAAHTKALATAYQKEGHGTVSFEVGHTPIQREQLDKGATPDVWIAANPNDMQTTADKGLVAPDTVAPLARTRLVVVVAPGNPGNITEVTDLAEPGAKVLLAAQTLPIWMTTAKTFEKIEQQHPGFTQQVEANTVSRELGVQPIVQKIQLGEADAGIVFVTDVPADPKGLTTVEIADEVNTELTLQIASVTAGKHPEEGRRFIEFMTTGGGREVLRGVGYLPPTA
ncbi:molybdate ABC transporter substrate-binding protein [Granulicoccus sp. GXG6511]|uniref:molybdate ABC transporter substrate-binding protein n=1 Tax=Granulicoccus sp. GXG6511 TaxID=3381351 RepID=UPI003D7DD90F